MTSEIKPRGRPKSNYEETKSIKLRLRKLTKPARDVFDQAKNKSELLRQSLEFFVRLNKFVSIADIDKDEIVERVSESVMVKMQSVLSQLQIQQNDTLKQNSNTKEELKSNQSQSKTGSTVFSSVLSKEESVINDDNIDDYQSIMSFGANLFVSSEKINSNS